MDLNIKACSKASVIDSYHFEMCDKSGIRIRIYFFIFFFFLDRVKIHIISFSELNLSRSNGSKIEISGPTPKLKLLEKHSKQLLACSIFTIALISISFYIFYMSKYAW